MSKEPVIVTAFWDMGRGENCSLPRTSERYVKEFKEWARIQNRLIVYTDAANAPAVKKVREDYGLLDKTTVVVNENIRTIEPEIYQRIHKVEKDPDFIRSRFRTNAMENHADFCYAWMLKYWAMQDSRKYVNEDDLIAWFDFGFNHMDVTYADMTQFNFLWKVNREIEKIQVYSLRDINKVNVFASNQFETDSVMGVFYLIPYQLAGKFYDTVREAMVANLDMETFDDDQQLVLMACKKYPEMYDVHVTDTWYLALKENGADHLKLVDHMNNVKPTIKARVDHKILIMNRYRDFLKRIRSLASDYIQK